MKSKADIAIPRQIRKMNLADPSLFDGLSENLTHRWSAYFYRSSRDQGKPAVLRHHAFALYDPFAKRSIFPAGIRFCVNVYVGCSHRCTYCYSRNYIAKMEDPRPKKDFIKQARKDIEELLDLQLPPSPLHVSNSTDPFQEALELKYRHTFSLMELIAKYRQCFTTVTFLTKNPLLAAQPPYLELLELLKPCQVEISLAFADDRARVIYEPHAPTVESRKEGIRLLRKAGVPVSLRVDPLFPREPLPKSYWKSPLLKDYRIEKTHTLNEIQTLISFAVEIGCQRIIVSPLKVPIGRRSGCKLKEVFKPLYTAPFNGKSLIRNFAMRLPTDYIHNDLIAPVARICRSLDIEMLHCKENLIGTK